MHRRFYSAVAVLLSILAAAPATADIPLPDHLTYIKPQMKFDGIGEHPEYVFYLRFLTFTGGPGDTPHTVVEVRDSKPFVLDCQRRLIDMKLLAIKRTDFTKLSKDQKSLAWLTDETEGVVAAEVQQPSTVAPKKAKTPPLSTYRVSLKDGKLEVESISRPKQEADSRGVLPNSMAGLAIAVGVAGFGLVLLRRRNAGRPPVVP